MIGRNQTIAFRIHDSAYKYRKNGTIPEDVVGGELKRVEYSATEGFQCWIDENKYPVNGYFDAYAMGACDPVKRYIRNWINLIAMNPVLWLALISKKWRQAWLNELNEFCQRTITGFAYEPQHYTRPVKEIYQATKGLPEHIQEAICVFLEHDRPYRYPMQDILGCLDKENLEKHPQHEINRLINLFVERDLRKDWSQMASLAQFLMFFPTFRNPIKQFLLKIDPTTIALDTVDLYNCLLNGTSKHHYKYMGLNEEQMVKLHMTL